MADLLAPIARQLVLAYLGLLLRLHHPCQLLVLRQRSVACTAVAAGRHWLTATGTTHGLPHLNALAAGKLASQLQLRPQDTASALFLRCEPL